MPAFYRIEKENRLVLSTASGVVTMPEVLAHQQKLSSDPDFDPTFCQLMDVSHITKIELTTEDIRRLAQETLFSPTTRRAILVNSDAAFGFARMFQMLRESAGETGIEVFRDLSEALEWVLAKRASA
jgi:hypothetical protein